MRQEDRAGFVKFYEESWSEMAPWFPLRPPGETFSETFDRTMAKAIKGAAEHNEFRLVGFNRGEKLVAFFGLMQIVRGAFESGVASWCVHSHHVSQGLCSEGVSAILDLAFASPPLGLGLHRIQANIIPTNAPSIRVAEKNGFRKEGIGRNYLKINGQWRDHAFYAKLAAEHQVRYL